MRYKNYFINFNKLHLLTERKSKNIAKVAKKLFLSSTGLQSESLLSSLATKNKMCLKRS